MRAAHCSFEYSRWAPGQSSSWRAAARSGQARKSGTGLFGAQEVPSQGFAAGLRSLRRGKMPERCLPRSMTFKVAVCDVQAELRAGSADWHSLCESVAEGRPDLLLLSEMPFGPWISSGASFD